MIVANFVLEYDMALPEGVTERYPNLLFGSSVSFPNPPISSANSRADMFATVRAGSDQGVAVQEDRINTHSA